jgi:hypothetical protein
LNELVDGSIVNWGCEIGGICENVFRGNAKTWLFPELQSPREPWKELDGKGTQIAEKQGNRVGLTGKNNASKKNT